MQRCYEKAISDPETRRRRSEAQKKFAATPKGKRQRSARMKALWKNPEFRARVKEGALKAVLSALPRKATVARGRRVDVEKRKMYEAGTLLYHPHRFGARQCAKRLDPTFSIDPDAAEDRMRTGIMNRLKELAREADEMFGAAGSTGRVQR